jgi:putative membrane protein
MRKLIRLLFLFATLAALAVPAAAHEEGPHNVSELLRAWEFDPLVIAGLALLAILYILGLYRLWRRTEVGSAVSVWHAAAFAGSWLSLFLALVSPLHPWGAVLFSAHMTQHEILMLISAPLLVLSRPMVASVWAVPASWRQPINSFFRSGPVYTGWRFLTFPLAAWIVHFIALWLWHLPYLFQATLRSDLVHTLQHFSFFGSALLFWWSIIAGRRGAQSLGAGVLFLFTTSMHSGILGAFLTFSTRDLYPAYAATSGFWGLSPLEDQQLGGLIMWIPAGLVYIVAALIMFAEWLAESEKSVRRRESSYSGGIV